MNDTLRVAMSNAGETCESLAEKIRVDPKTVARWLSPGRVPHPRHRKMAADILRQDVQKLWPNRRREMLWFRPWRDVEREAISLRSYEPLVIPGLLQTPAYARAVLAGAGLIGPEDVDGHVISRIERQVILERTTPPVLTAVLDEGALRRGVGSPDVMREQLLHLVDVAAERPHVRVHIVPFSAGVYAGINGPFVLADLAGPRVVAHLDNQLSGQTVSDAADVARLVSSWESCRSEALPHRQSIELIREFAGTWN
ncbi:Scr1 family TA system antitoxin-like transcriptional regulator [Micromonospora zhanjiangensis]|uniref:Scr1 family TA system antitoxin-like transcriptional regulator n=1 Tax=Micromonospora zhanjiangensis TaxID=1522057 RepID=A0ABV8KSM3_9ACTN